MKIIGVVLIVIGFGQSNFGLVLLGMILIVID